MRHIIKMSTVTDKNRIGKQQEKTKPYYIQGNYCKTSTDFSAETMQA